MNHRLFIIFLISTFLAFFALYVDSARADEPAQLELSRSPESVMAESQAERALRARAMIRQAGMVEGIVSKAMRVIYTDQKVVEVPERDLKKE